MKNLILTLAVILSAFAVSAQEVALVDGKFYNDGQLYSGSFSEYDQHGNVLVTHEKITNGLEDGAVTYYRNDGNVKEIRSYKDGLKDGTWITWFENGNKSGEASYAQGQKDGVWYVWDENGRLRYEMYYKNGQKDSTWKIWDDEGILLSSKDF